jgi:putative zinc finger/helix-turn-helix YgiT family protein
MTIRQQTGPERGDRPFPWKCSTCLRREVLPTEVPYTAEVKHDGVLHTLPLPALKIARCQSCGALFFTEETDEQISNALRAKLRLLTPTQIRAARKKLSADQKALAERLGVAKETISRWETGALIQSRAMDNLLRVYFALQAVRAVLTGGDQDPLLGVEGSQPGSADPPEDTVAGLSRFSYAMAAYGEDRLIATVRSYRGRGTLLPVGRE